MGNSPTNYIDPTGWVSVPAAASYLPSGRDIAQVTARYHGYMAALSRLYAVAMRVSGRAPELLNLSGSSRYTGYIHVYAPDGWFTSGEWLATIAYDSRDPEDQLLALLIAERIDAQQTVQAVGQIVANAPTQGFDVAVRTALDPVDTVASFSEFVQDPSWASAAGMLPIVPGSLGSLRRLAPESEALQLLRRGDAAYHIGVREGREYLLTQRGLRETDWWNPFELDGAYGQGFDDVMQDADGNLWIVEYKGGTGRLADSQMEQPWVLRNIERLEADTWNPWGTILRDAFEAGRLRGIAVQAPLSGTPQEIAQWTYIP